MRRRSKARREAVNDSTLGHYFKCEEQEECFDTVVTAVHEVAQEKVVAVRAIAAHLKGTIKKLNQQASSTGL